MLMSSAGGENSEAGSSSSSSSGSEENKTEDDDESTGIPSEQDSDNDTTSAATTGDAGEMESAEELQGLRCSACICQHFFLWGVHVYMQQQQQSSTSTSTSMILSYTDLRRTQLLLYSRLALTERRGIMILPAACRMLWYRCFAL